MAGRREEKGEQTYMHGVPGVDLWLIIKAPNPPSSPMPSTLFPLFPQEEISSIEGGAASVLGRVL